MGVADHSNDGAQRLLVPLPDLEVLPDGLFVGPVFAGQRLVDERHPGSAGRIGFAEIPAAQEGNLENAQIAGRNTHPSADLPARFGMAGNMEAPRVIDLVGQPDRRG